MQMSNRRKSVVWRRNPLLCSSSNHCIGHHIESSPFCRTVSLVTFLLLLLLLLLLSTQLLAQRKCLCLNSSCWSWFALLSVGFHNYLLSFVNKCFMLLSSQQLPTCWAQISLHGRNPSCSKLAAPPQRRLFQKYWIICSAVCCRPK